MAVFVAVICTVICAVNLACGNFLSKLRVPTTEETTMKRIALILAVCVMSGPAFATCKSDAADKKLAGAALKSAVTKCTKDATTTCEADSKEKKLAGAAKKSHMKKCVEDAVGT
jgi:hypothetical protein